jgi:DNA-binding transcriptional LysR family regulator
MAPLSQELKPPANPGRFNPGKASGVIRVAMSDAAEFVLLPTLIRRLAKEAPGVDLRARPLDKETAFEALDAGKLDGLVGVFGKLPKRYDRRALWNERFACVLRRHTNERPELLTLRSYARKPHVLVSLRDDARGYVDEVLARHGLTRRVIATVGRFMIVPYVIEATDCIATLPSRMAHRVVQGTQCVVVEPPFKMQPWQEALIWHRGTERTPLHAWFRSLMTECAPNDTASQSR